MNETYTFLGILSAIIVAGAVAAWKLYVKPYKDPDVSDLFEPQTLDSPSVPTAWVDPAPTPVSEPPVAPPAMLWATPKQAYHSTRGMCDEMGLTFAQKNILCACIYQESNFLNYHSNGKPVINQNKDKDGKVWSTDWGIVQVNDTKGWHIGKGLRFPSVQYVMDNPEVAVRWMVSVMKGTGKLQPWSSFTSGVYKKHLIPTSQMWLLKS